MIRTFVAFTAAASLLVLAATPAAAQVAGVYSGTSADGSNVSLTVVHNDVTNKPEVTGSNVSFAALCNDGSTVHEGWGYFVGQDVSHHKLKYNSHNDYYSITFDLTWAPDDMSATGTITSITAVMKSPGPAAKKALFCASPSQAVGLSLQAPMARVPAPENQARSPAAH